MHTDKPLPRERLVFEVPYTDQEILNLKLYGGLESRPAEDMLDYVQRRSGAIMDNETIWLLESYNQENEMFSLYSSGVPVLTLAHNLSSQSNNNCILFIPQLNCAPDFQNGLSLAEAVQIAETYVTEHY